MNCRVNVMQALLVSLTLAGCDAPPAQKTGAIFNGILDVKGIHIAMADEDVERLAPVLNAAKFDKPQSSNYAKLSCGTNSWGKNNECQFTLANRQVKSAEFHFHENQLGEAIFKFDDRDFETVSQGLVAKFGTPYSINKTDLKNQLTGVESTSTEIVWIDNKGHELKVTSHKKDGNSYIPEGQIWLTDKYFSDQRQADSSSLGAKPGNKDL